MNETILRQADNKVECVGFLKSKDFSYGVNRENIRGTIVIETSADSEHTISLWANAKNKDGSPSKSFDNLDSFASSAVSIAELMAGGKKREEAEAECSCVSIRGQLEVNDYCGRDGSIVSRPQIGTRFVSQLDRTKPITPCASFDVECFINANRMESKNGESTGRLIVEALIPGYEGRVIPFTFIVPEDMADDFLEACPAKKTTNLWGNLVNTVNVVTTHKQGIGAAKEERKTNYVHEYIVTGASPAYDDESPKAFNPDAVMKAVQVRVNETLPAVVARFNQKKAEKATAGVGFNRPAAPANPVTNFQV